MTDGCKELNLRKTLMLDFIMNIQWKSVMKEWTTEFVKVRKKL